MRLKELRGQTKQKDFVRKLKRFEPRIDIGLYSKYENGVALPTPEQLRSICNLLEAEPLDIYSEKEINLKGCLKVHKDTVIDKSESDIYKLCVRLERNEAKLLLDKEALSKCGYRSLTHWVKVGLIRLRQEYERTINREKKKPLIFREKTNDSFKGSNGTTII